MTPVDYSPGNLLAARVVVQAMWRTLGEAPLALQLVDSPAARGWVWEREARRYLVETYRRRQAGLRPLQPRDLLRMQDEPQEWAELAGERSGEEEHVGTKKTFFCDPSLPFSVVAK